MAFLAPAPPSSLRLAFRDVVRHPRPQKPSIRDEPEELVGREEQLLIQLNVIAGDQISERVAQTACADDVGGDTLFVFAKVAQNKYAILATLAHVCKDVTVAGVYHLHIASGERSIGLTHLDQAMQSPIDPAWYAPGIAALVDA